MSVRAEPGIDRIPLDLLVVPIHETEKPLQGSLGALDWRLCGQLSELTLNHKITGAKNEKTLLINQTARIPISAYLIVGLGNRSAAKAYAGNPLPIGETIAETTQSVSSRRVGILMDHFFERGEEINLLTALYQKLKIANTVEDLYFIFSNVTHATDLEKTTASISKPGTMKTHTVIENRQKPLSHARKTHAIR